MKPPKEKYFKLCEQCELKCKMKGIGELTWCPKRVPKGGKHVERSEN